MLLEGAVKNARRWHAKALENDIWEYREFQIKPGVYVIFDWGFEGLRDSYVFIDMNKAKDFEPLDEEYHFLGETGEVGEVIERKLSKEIKGNSAVRKLEGLPEDRNTIIYR